MATIEPESMDASMDSVDARIAALDARMDAELEVLKGLVISVGQKLDLRNWE